LKKVLLEKADLRPGRIQMVNWASLGVGKEFARHYHEDMQEIFILVAGEAEITVAAETATLRRGDAVVIDPREVHQMRNAGTEAVEYLAIGITSEAGGKTVVMDLIKEHMMDSPRARDCLVSFSGYHTRNGAGPEPQFPTVPVKENSLGSTPVPEPVHVVLNQLESGAVVGDVQLGERQVDLEPAPAGLAENAVELVAQVPGRVEQLDDGAAKLGFLLGAGRLRVVCRKRQRQIRRQVRIVPGQRILIDFRQVAGRPAERRQDPLCLVRTLGKNGRNLEANPTRSVNRGNRHGS
jgi:mannose-6-phosphate isomerase-like protein (cupin superfamily)